MPASYAWYPAAAQHTVPFLQTIHKNGMPVICRHAVIFQKHSPLPPNIGGTGGLFFNTAQFPYVLLRKAGISRHQLVGLLLSKGIDEQKPIFAFFIKITGNVRVIDKDLHPFLGLLAYPILESVYLFFVDLHEDGWHLFKLPPATDIKSECIQRYRQKHEHQHKHVSHSILLKLISS